MKSLFLLFITLPIYLSAQITFDKVKHDFGNLNSYDDRFVDIKVTNLGSKKGYVLRVKKPMEVVYLAKAPGMEKDSSVYLRFQVNPKEKGRFQYDIEVYTSDKDLPTVIQLKGSLNDLPAEGNLFTACPDFNSRPGGKAYSFDLIVITIDKETRKEIPDTKVTLLQNGQPIWLEQTDKQGRVKKEASLGFSYFFATHPSYKSAEMGAYINFHRNEIVIELEKNPISANTSQTTDPKNDISEVSPEEELNQELIADVSRKDSIDLNQQQNFTEQNYKPINVIFVLDVSSSMNQGDKIELMKYTLLQLVELLRPCDNMGIVTYSDNARVLLPPTTGADKANIQSEVSNLKAAGLTAGGTGIKMGYKEAMKHLDDESLNLVIVVTDGAFNKDSEDYKKQIKKYKKKGVSMSIIGIKLKDSDRQKMLEVTQLSGGNLIPVDKLADAEANLKKEIKSKAFKSN